MRVMEHKRGQSRFVVCPKNEGYAASLEPRTIYGVIPDAQAEAHGMIRIVDESGEDYLYPASLFSPITLPPSLVDSLVWAG
jgi:hypothetical protein